MLRYDVGLAHPLQNTDNLMIEGGGGQNWYKLEALQTFPERFTLTKKQLEPNLLSRGRRCRACNKKTRKSWLCCTGVCQLMLAKHNTGEAGNREGQRNA